MNGDSKSDIADFARDVGDELIHDEHMDFDSPTAIKRRRSEPTTMPHVIVKMYAGRTEQDKQRLAEALTQAVMSTLSYGEEAVSVAIEDVPPERWAEDVVKPDLLAKRDKVYKEPGYPPFRKP